jgi:hypothetical protein
MALPVACFNSKRCRSTGADASKGSMLAAQTRAVPSELAVTICRLFGL